MLGSMYSAVSGLQAHQTKMNVIGNNIANVNTYGYKASRVTFTDVFYQTINGASSPTKDSGGTNPTQLGYGAKVGSIDVINTRAGSATTDRALDIYINGDGYLPVKDTDGIVKYTRVGVLSFDPAGNLVDSNGNMILGLPMDSATGVNQLGADGTLASERLVPINIKSAELDKYTGIAIGQNGEITGIKEGDPILVRATGTGDWLKDAKLSKSSNYNGPVILSAEANATDPSTLDIKITTFDKSGKEVTTTATIDPATWTGTLNLGDLELTIDPTNFNAIDATDLQNGITIGNAGAGAGKSVKIANLAVAKFINPNGLSQDGEGYYVETTNSGKAVTTVPGNGGTGNLVAGSLEMSNVDLSKEFTEMIIAQRGFQANTRMITTSDEMLSELVSMKR